MSNPAKCGLTTKADILNLHDFCHGPECKSQKHTTFTPRQFQLDGSGFRNTMKIIFEGNEKIWNIFIKPGLKIATPIISAGVAAKTKEPQSAEIASNILKSLTYGKILSLTDMYANRLRVKVK